MLSTTKKTPLNPYPPLVRLLRPKVNFKGVQSGGHAIYKLRPTADDPFFRPRRYPLKKFSWSRYQPKLLDWIQGPLLISSPKIVSQPSVYGILSGFRSKFSIIDFVFSQELAKRSLNFLRLLSSNPASPLLVSFHETQRTNFGNLLRSHIKRFHPTLSGYFQRPKGGVLSNFKSMFPSSLPPSAILALADETLALVRESYSLNLPCLAPMQSRHQGNFFSYPIPMNNHHSGGQVLLWVSFLTALLEKRKVGLNPWKLPLSPEEGFRGIVSSPNLNTQPVGKWNRTTTSAFSGPRSTVKPSRQFKADKKKSL